MDKEKYINTLEKELRKLPEEEHHEVINYYNEYLDDVLADQGSLENLDNPRKTAQLIYGNYFLEQSEVLDNKPKKSFKLVMSIILLVLAAPIGLPLSIALVALIAALAIAGFALLFALALLVVTLFGVGLVGIILGIVTIFTNMWQSIAVIGMGFIGLGLGIIATIGLKKLFDFSIKSLKSIAKKISRKVNNDEV